jgi:hypothetical protein
MGSGYATEVIGGIKTLVAMEAQKAAQTLMRGKATAGSPGSGSGAGDPTAYSSASSVSGSKTRSFAIDTDAPPYSRDGERQYGFK